jgi:hypothetical protein
MRRCTMRATRTTFELAADQYFIAVHSAFSIMLVLGPYCSGRSQDVSGLPLLGELHLITLSSCSAATPYNSEFFACSCL